MGYVTGMHVDMGLRFSVNFTGKFPEICWYQYWDAHVAKETSQEMLDQ